MSGKGPTADDIERLKAKVNDLGLQHHAAKKALREALIAASGVSIGDVVRHRGADYRVTDIDATGWRVDKPWLHGNPRKKDGTFGNSVRNLYADWEHP